MSKRTAVGTAFSANLLSAVFLFGCGDGPATKQIFGGWDFRVDLELALGLARQR